jgi:hypothetical protein
MQTKYNIGDRLHTIDSDQYPGRYKVFTVSDIKIYEKKGFGVCVMYSECEDYGSWYAERKCGKSKEELRDKLNLMIDDVRDVIEAGLVEDKKD